MMDNMANVPAIFILRETSNGYGFWIGRSDRGGKSHRRRLNQIS